MAHPPYSPYLAPARPLDEESSEGDILPMWERSNKEQQQRGKASTSTSSNTAVSAGKNALVGVLHQTERTVKMTEIYTCRNKYTIFINKFQGFFGSPRIGIILDTLLSFNSNGTLK